MVQLIDKAALVAEIERRRSDVKKHCDELSPFYYSDTYMYALDMFDDILSFLDTLETKEVDLEEELNKWRHNHFHGKRDDKGANGEYLTRVSQLEIARYFYELGLKTKE